MKKYTVTVGIPAYNEEFNISRLLEDIKAQNEEKVVVEKIIVISDMSTDSTNKKVYRTNDKRVRLIINTSRVGKAVSQNKITELSNTDFLIILDADIRIVDKNFVEKLLKPMIMSKNIDLVSPRILPLRSTSFFGKVIDFSSEMKNLIYGSLNKGQNIYSCHGRARAFSKRLYKKIVWSALASEDAFSYLYALKHDFGFYFQPATEIYYKSPQNFEDHLSQSRRFLDSKRELQKMFSEKVLNREYRIDVIKILTVVFAKTIQNPFFLIAYLLVLFRVKMSNNKYGAIWDAPKSSKTLTAVK